MMTLKVYIIDKLAIVREGIRALLAEHKEIEVVGLASAYDDSKHELKNADVLLIEHEGDAADTLEKVREIQSISPHLKILLLSDGPEGPDFLNHMLTAGISGYITKNAGSDELAYGIKKVAEEGIYICTAFILKFLRSLPAPQPKSIPTPSLTLARGEAEVLKLISEGLTNKEIADKLFISVRTVESRRKKLLEKTHTTNTATLIKYCLKAGLID